MSDSQQWQNEAESGEPGPVLANNEQVQSSDAPHGSGVTRLFKMGRLALYGAALLLFAGNVAVLARPELSAYLPSVGASGDDPAACFAKRDMLDRPSCCSHASRCSALAKESCPIEDMTADVTEADLDVAPPSPPLPERIGADDITL